MSEATSRAATTCSAQYLLARSKITAGQRQSQRISISLNGQYFGEELIVETAPNHLAS